MPEQTDERKEEHAYVLDFMLNGKSSSGKSEPISQLVGERWFTLLEATTKPGSTLTIGERVYIGNGERDKIMLIKARISYSELTQTANNELRTIVSNIVRGDEKRFVSAFNSMGPLNIREHSLELLPGIGKKHLNAILKERSAKPFESFEDIEKRVPLMQDPAKLIVERIIMELEGSERFYMFVKPYFKK